MITQLRVKWFRSFRDSTEISIAPITLLYGQNAAGKSSIVKALLFLKQSQGDEVENGYFMYSGRVTDLGSAAAMAYMHRSYEPTRLAVRLEARLSEKLGGAGGIEGRGVGEMEVEFFLPHDDLDYQVCYRFLGLPDKPELTWSATTVENSSRVLVLNNESLDAFRRLFGSQTPALLDDDPTGEFDLFARPVMSCRGVLPGAQIGLFSGKFREFPRYRREKQAYLDQPVVPSAGGWDVLAGEGLRRVIQQRFERISHVGPARRMPNRIETRAEVTSSGSPGLIASLREDETLRVRINRQLRNMGVDYEISSNKTDDPVLGEMYSLHLRNVRSGVTTALTDVGYGISQVLPVLLEANRPDVNLLLVEQPELHLHPRLQAELGDLLIDAVSGGTSRQAVVETHSEALVLRLQRRIRQGVLSRELVKVLYVDQDEQGVSHVKELHLDDSGEFISEWPNGFFAERLQELEF